VEKVEHGIIKGLSDATPATRANARKSFVEYNKLWPQRVPSFLERLDLSIQRMLMDGKSSPQKSPARTPKDFRKFLQEKKQLNLKKEDDQLSDSVVDGEKK